MNPLMRLHASAISKKYFFVSSGSIDLDLRILKGFAEIGITDRSRLHEINGAVEQAFEILREPEIVFCMIRRRYCFELNDQIEIACCGIEPITGCRTKNCEATDPAVRAYPDDFVQVLFDDAMHVSSPRCILVILRYVAIVFPDSVCG